MKKSFYRSILFISCLILSCSTVFAKSKAWINSNVAGNLLSEKPRLQDDFYQAVNYDELKNCIIPEDKYSIARPDLDSDVLNQQMLSMLQNNSESSDYEEQQLRTLFKQAGNWEKRNSDGIKPILPVLKKIQNAKKLKDLEELIYDEDAVLFLPIHTMFASNNPYYIVYIDTTILFGEKSEIYSDFYQKMMVKAGYSQDEAKNLLSQASDFESKYKNIGTGNVAYWVDFESLFKNLPYEKILEANGAVQMSYYWCSDRLKEFDSLYTEENLDAIKTLYICNLFLSTADYLDRETYEYKKQIDEELYGRSLKLSDESIVLGFLNIYAPMLLGKIWVKNYFSEEMKEDATNLVNLILEKYIQEIMSWEWLSTGTRYNATTRLKNIKVIVGYSNKFPDYSELDFSHTSSLYESVMKIVKFNKLEGIKKSHELVDPYEWLMSPQTFNAFYIFDNNSINICAGYLLGTGYDVNWSIEEKLGVIGFTMAHEISHSFSMGNIENNPITLFWKPEDFEKIMAKIGEVSDYYSNFEIFEGMNVNGSQCIPEIGADFFGMNLTLKLAKDYDNFDYKLFFESYAKMEFLKGTEEYLKQKFAADTHPIYYLRTNALLQQFDEFYEAYGIKKRDGMYLAGKKRIKIEK